MLAPLIAAALVAATPRLQIDDLGPLTAAPSDLRAAPGLTCVYHTQREQEGQVVQLVRNGQPQGWFRASGIFEFTPDGQDWWIRARENGRPALVVNGKFEVRDLEIMSVVTNRPPTRILGSDGDVRLEVSGKVVQRGRQMFASMTGQGLLRAWQDAAGVWHQATNTWSVSGEAMPVHFELADGRILSRLGTQLFLNGKPIPGAEPLDEYDDVGISPSGRNWFHVRSSGDVPQVWINGRRSSGLTSDAEWLSDEAFEISPLLRQPTLLPGQSEESWRLLRLTPGGLQPATPEPVYATVEESYVESPDGRAFGLLAEISEGQTGVVFNGKVLKTWPTREGETVWLNELALHPRGTELAFVDPAPEGQYVMAGSRRWGPYQQVKPLRERPAVLYSPDGRHLAYFAIPPGESAYRLFVNGVATALSLDYVVYFGEPRWEPSGELRLMAVRQGRVVRVRVRP